MHKKNSPSSWDSSTFSGSSAGVGDRLFFLSSFIGFHSLEHFVTSQGFTIVARFNPLPAALTLPSMFLL